MKNIGLSLLLGTCLPALAAAPFGVLVGADATTRSIWNDPATGLIWTAMDNGSDLDWNQATAYCSNLQLAGYGGWRLPTIEELQGIYDSSSRTQTNFDFGPVLVYVKGNLRLTGWDWSSSQADKPGFEQTFGFSNEQKGAFPIGFSYNMRALCVHHSSE